MTQIFSNGQINSQYITKLLFDEKEIVNPKEVAQNIYNYSFIINLLKQKNILIM